MLTQKTPKPLRWQRSKYSPLTRQIDVFSAAGTFLFYLWWDRLWGNNASATKQKRAKWLIKTMLDLGPTFIKIGQALSTRADILPLEYVAELEKLQDKVPPFSADRAVAIIESELGNSLFSLYREFNERPLAAASLGQVHRAKLHTGEQVIVKVQRPGLKELFDLDMQAVRRVMRFCQRSFAWARLYDLDAIYNEFFMILYQEIDYIKEGKNADRFRDNFDNYSGIIVPKVYWEYTTHKVLTLEYLPGIKVDDRKTLQTCGVDIKRVNQLGICCYLKQILQDGFFQADPHPGNIAVSPNGSLIFYDFGMMAEIKALAKDQMIRSFFAVMRKDVDVVIDTLIDIGLVEPMSDMTPVRRLIRFLLDEFTEKPIDFQAFNVIKDELYIMFEQQPFRLPAEMTFLLKSLTTLDGVARALDPEYNLVDCAQPFIKSITVSKQERGSLVGELTKQARDFINFKFNQPSRAEVFISRLEQRIEEGEIKFRVRSIESDRALKRVNFALKTLIHGCWSGFTLISGILLIIAGKNGWAVFFLVMAGVGVVIFLRSLLNLSIRERLDRMAEQ
ncbi:MAG: AarF/ABC1/UbiB kinase family protein [Arthrospira sp. PLM2.Bin9]|nr:AarF/ABC1/UbiB kinase family protein [Arthrospira sp. PLM2.Bin9]TVU51853.1 MAG: AarF/ABC1/UbiB kinase family protein [Arthrospira sp. PLM2.Bin9]